MFAVLLGGWCGRVNKYGVIVGAVVMAGGADVEG